MVLPSSLCLSLLKAFAGASCRILRLSCCFLSQTRQYLLPGGLSIKDAQKLDGNTSTASPFEGPLSTTAICLIMYSNGMPLSRARGRLATSECQSSTWFHEVAHSLLIILFNLAEGYFQVSLALLHTSLPRIRQGNNGNAHVS